MGAGMTCLQAQAPGVPIESARPMAQDKVLLEKLDRLREGGKALDTEAIKAGLKSPAGAADLTLPLCHTSPLRPAEVWAAAERSRIWVGWHYLCHKCDHWHVNLAGGYPIAGDTVATCYHVAEPGKEIREGELVAVNGAGDVFPVTAVLAANRTMDGAVLRVEGLQAEALPLNDQIRPGDPAFLLSNPLGLSGYFSEGMVNRFYWSPRRRGADDGDLRYLRMHASTDWAPGSSGSPVLDTCGNVIGHVATIAHLGEGEGPGGAKVPHLTVHEAIPARAMAWLIRNAARPETTGEGGDLARLRQALDARNFASAKTLIAALEKTDDLSDAARAELLWGKFLTAIADGEDADARTAAEGLASGVAKDDAEQLNRMAWTLLTELATPTQATLTAAEAIARRAAEASGRNDPAVLDTLARAAFRLDHRDEAIHIQEEAIARADGQLKASLAETLAAYRDGRLPAAEPEG